MRNLFALIGVLVVGVGGAGWYLGWYKVNFTKNTEGNLQIQTDVDTKKLSGDSAEFFQKVGQLVDDKLKQAGQSGTTPPATTPANTPGSTPSANKPLPGSGVTNPTNPTPAAPPPPPTPPDEMP
jgi:hypothetical protein